jgi:hypothetical protein
MTELNIQIEIATLSLRLTEHCLLLSAIFDCVPMEAHPSSGL